MPLSSFCVGRKETHPSVFYCCIRATIFILDEKQTKLQLLIPLGMLDKTNYIYIRFTDAPRTVRIGRSVTRCSYQCVELQEKMFQCEAGMIYTRTHLKWPLNLYNSFKGNALLLADIDFALPAFDFFK